MGNVDRLRELREQNYAERQASHKAASKQEKLKKAKASMKQPVTDKNYVTDKICTCIICNETFKAKRVDATICSASCRMRKCRAKRENV